MYRHDPEAGLLYREQMDRPLIIQKVPQSVRGGLEKRYFVPDVVSIGPYHHHSEEEKHLAEMEKVKETVAHEFCQHSALAVAVAGQASEAATTVVARLMEAVTRILPDARGCYADARFGNDKQLAYMMVVDGCFLLAVMAVLTRSYPEGLDHWWWTHGRMLRIMKDILLFENQIPWIVLRAFMALLQPVPVDAFVDRILDYFDIGVHNRRSDGAQPPPSHPPLEWERLNPVHLLDLVHQRHLGLGSRVPVPADPIRYCDYARPFAHFTSAVELAEAGIHLHGSGTCRVTDVRVEPAMPAKAMFRLHLYIGRLVLPQLALSWLPRCWLINMVALECVTDRFNHSGVSSYLAILGSLVRAERDVEELRSRRILFSTMSDRRTVEFFEGLLDPLPRQDLYLRTLDDIVQLRARRSTRSNIHTVYYRNRSIIFAAAPLLSLLVAIIGIAVTNSIKHK
ncbi:unnamed protein product [Urochloa decumbens]|uniref:Uncharacterized protein n=1 Tax=Urochloa decumbens TaxID=240449 RepID=A0ABC8WC52_9POAL